jgi:hypothetical protein
VGLVVIGPTWLDTRDAAGARRLDAVEDMVRLEIEALLQSQVPVIPLLVQGVSLPKVGELPSSLSQLAFRQARPIRVDPDYQGDLKMVVHDSAPYLPLPRPSTAAFRRAGNTVRRVAGLTLSTATLVLLVNAVLNFFGRGLDFPGLTALLHQLIGH